MAAISDQMMIYLDGKGIEIDAVLLKSIQLPVCIFYFYLALLSRTLIEYHESTQPKCYCNWS